MLITAPVSARRSIIYYTLSRRGINHNTPSICLLQNKRTHSTTTTNTNTKSYQNINTRPLRSMLYVPASNSRALAKLESLSGVHKPDCVMFDLEDGCAPNKKDESRGHIYQFLQDRKPTSTTSNKKDYFGLIRINRVDTKWFEDDAYTAFQMSMSKNININGIVLPKIESRQDVDLIAKHMLSLCNNDDSLEDESDGSSSIVSPVPIWAMIETPRAILSVAEIAAHSSVQGLIIGTNDLSKELQLRPTCGSLSGTTNTTRDGLATSLQLVLLAGKAYNKPVIDGVYNNFSDEEGFRDECMQGKEWGMDGKTLIHPSQISACNKILAPSQEEIEYAKSVVSCWEGSLDKGVAVLNGMMIEQLHVSTSKQLLDRAEVIESMS